MRGHVTTSMPEAKKAEGGQDQVQRANGREGGEEDLGGLCGREEWVLQILPREGRTNRGVGKP